MKKLVLALTLTLGLTANAMAAVDAKDIIDYRQSVYNVIGWNMGTIAGMVKGEVEFDSAKAVAAATRLHEMAMAAPETFVPATYEGSKAKASIEDNRADFDKFMKMMIDESAAMVKAAEKKETMAPQLGKLGQSCKSCHDSYRLD